MSTDISLRYLLFGEDKSASSTITGTATTAKKTGAIISSTFSKLGGSIGGPIGEAFDHVQGMFETLGGDSHTLGQKATAAGVGIAGLGAGLSVLGSHEKEASNALQAALGTTGHSIDDYKSQIEETIKTQENYNHSAADTQNALATLTEATGSPTKAFDHMQLVADLAAQKHMDLNSAASMVARTLGGSTRLMTQYGVVVQKNADGSNNMDLAVSQLSDKLGGQAAASVDSYSGHLKVLETKIHDQISLWGEKFGPALQMGGAALAVVGTVTQIVANRQLMAAAATDAETVATEGQAVASKASAAATWLLGAAMDALPIFALIAAIALLVVGIIYAYKHSETFRNLVTGAFHAVTGAATAAFGWITGHWKLLFVLLTGPIGAATLFIVSHWAQITGAVGNAIGWVRSHWPLLLAILTGPFGLAALFISRHLDTITGWIGAMPGRIKGAASGMWSGVTGAFRDAINGVIDIWNGLHFSVPGFSAFGHHVGGFTISVPQLQHLAMGGTLTNAGAVMIGEHGTEVLNLPAGASVRPLTAAEARGRGVDSSGLLGVFAVDLRLDGRIIQRLLLKLKRENGGLTLGLA